MKGGGGLLDSIDYYNKYASIYFENTVNLSMEKTLTEFLQLLPEGASVLDLGCGSGRDSLVMLDQGFDVTALDGSVEMCSLAQIHTDLDVLNMTFEDLDFNEVFDGIWACASLVHVEPKNLPDILNKVHAALKPEGIFYMSVKRGDFKGYRNERYFADYHKKDLKELFSKIEGFNIIDIWITNDVRPGRSSDSWINLLAKKVEIDE